MPRHATERSSVRIASAFGLVAALSGVLSLASGCGTTADDAPPAFVPMECPAPAASAEPNLHTSGNRLYLSWLVHGETGHTFQYAVRENDAWSEARTIAAGDSFFANWADVPSLVQLGDGSLVAHWLWRSGSDTYAYDVMLAHSKNGIDWQPAYRPHRDGTQTEHGFASLIPVGGPHAVAVWLDGRDYAEKEHGDAEMQLMSTVLGPDGAQPESPIDMRVCDCCPTSAVRTSAGLLVAYRDRSDKEVRDISLARLEEGTWSEPYPLSNDGWEIAGCPVNGPALDASASHVVAAWYTIANEEPSVRVSFSGDGGRTFSPFVRVDDGEPLGRVDVVLLPAGQALVVWLESPAEGEASIRARRVHTDGKLDDSFVVTGTSADRASGFPRLTRIGSDIYVAWTQIDVSGDGHRVHMAHMELPRSWRVLP